MTKRASASGEHAKDAKDPDSIDEKAIHETGPVKSQLSIDEKAIHETGPVQSQLSIDEKAIHETGPLKSQLHVGRVKHRRAFQHLQPGAPDELSFPVPVLRCGAYRFS